MTKREPKSVSADHSTEREGTPPYEVGYGRPPLATRFKPGQSGNARGRPKGDKNLSTLTREKLQAKVAVREGGRERRMSKGEIGVTKLVNRFAETGDPKLYLALVKLLEGGCAANGTTSAPHASSQPEAGQASDAEILDWFLGQQTSSSGGES